MTRATASGKVILVGEHAVVYGRPAIAVPVTGVQALAAIEPGSAGQGTVVVAPDLGRQVAVREASDDDPLAHIVRIALRALKQPADPDLTLAVTSTIPVARGMGSGAAVSTAIVRALARHYNRWLASQAISDLVYQTEVIYHGTPSGIDNTVVAFEKPVYFVKDTLSQIFWPGTPFRLAIADTGIQCSTRRVVDDLRQRYYAQPAHYEPLFSSTGEIAVAARSAIERGDLPTLGHLMDDNHALLQAMGVSSSELDCLVVTARDGGALGAKMSGSGWGGNMIALVTEPTQGRVDMMLRLAGATNVMITEVK